jgi:hypothetical protein
MSANNARISLRPWNALNAEAASLDEFLHALVETAPNPFAAHSPT